ncbi:hypothetical protein jhhlp_001846 [Lomentospora prolificans]|uniref:Rhodopsin domain-containing protein n=1 Tax=Lomentospora prolificans TaxID=41688 RepID=A0A2N3NCA5_9PEZI|nr:hypothetical protein jhhlp_001846 [Lomentospora prolificans]
MADTAAIPVPPTGPMGPPIGIHGPERSYSVDIIVCSIITAVIGSIFVGLRFYARGVLMHVLGLEDWLILIAQAVLGLGKHWWWLDFANVVPMSQAGWYSILFYEMSLWFSQTAILILYLRIWTYPWVRRCTWILMAIIVAYNMFVFVSIFIACIPLEAFWDFTVPSKYCHTTDVWFANTYLHIATDFLIYFLPMPVILRLRFPRRQKILLFVLFAFGFLYVYSLPPPFCPLTFSSRAIDKDSNNLCSVLGSVCMISIIRLVYLILTKNTTDVPYDNTTIAFWTTVETNATVIIACFMTMKPLLAKWFPSLIEPSNDPSNEMQDASPDANGRMPTIGSTPTRPPNSNQDNCYSWMIPSAHHTGASTGKDEQEERDLEAADSHSNASGQSTLKKASLNVRVEKVF